jgi:hypothetical protein
MPIWVQNLLLPAVVSVVASIVGLFIEYRTGWFARGVSTVQRRTEKAVNLFAGQSVTPVTELENPVGDWMQIAREVKTLLKTECDVTPSLYLHGITPRRGKAAELEFVDDGRYVQRFYTVTVDAMGRITKFTHT